MSHLQDRTVTARSYLLVTLAVVGITGCAAVIIGMWVPQTMVPDHHWVSDEISDLAADD